MEDPGEFLLTDFAKMERSPLLHLGFQALDAFASKVGGVLRNRHSTDGESTNETPAKYASLYEHSP
jgi:hypothetical protein